MPSIAWRNRINQMLNHGGLQIVYQPICALNDRRNIVGYEALSRFPHCEDLTKEEQTPDVWFSQAERLGMGAEMEIMAVACAIEAIPVISPAYLSVNVSANTLLLEPFATLILGSFPERIVVELTEHDVVDSYDPLHSALGRLRGHADAAAAYTPKLARLAIDDVGTGHSGLVRIIKLNPDVLKLDRSMVENVDSDTIKGALIAGLVIFAASTGMSMVAEGVETEAEFEALRSLGVDNGQGWLLGRPEPLPGIGECRGLIL